MVLYRDNANNLFLGDVSYNTTNYQVNSNVTLANVYNPLLNLILGAGLQLDYIPFENDFKTIFTIYGSHANRIAFIISAANDMFRRRIALNFSGTNNLYSDLGHPIVSVFTDTSSSTNLLSSVGNLSTSTTITASAFPFNVAISESSYNFFAVATRNSLGLLVTIPNSTTNPVPLSANRFGFYYFAFLNINGINDSNRYVRLNSYFNGGSPASIGIYRHPNELGNISNIICGKHLTDIEITSDISSYYPANNELQYATDFYMNVAQNQRVNLPNLKLGHGHFEPLRPIRLLNYTGTDNNTWIPVGIIGGRSLLLQCYSSSVNANGITSVPLISNRELSNPHYRPSNP